MLRNTVEVKRSEKPLVIIDSDLVGYMVALHDKYKAIEWSGHIFYEKIGSMEDPANLVFKVKDFVVLDVGSAARTEIENNADQIINIHNRVPEFMEGKVSQGLLHTHHNMATYFSGTDTDTLFEAIEDYKFDLFLSVITNFKLDIVAKIAIKGKTVKSNSTFTFKDGMYIENMVLQELDSIHTFDCNIKVELNNRYSEDLALVDKYYQAKNLRSVTNISNNNSKFFKEIGNDFDFPGLSNITNPYKNKEYPKQLSLDNLRPLSQFQVTEIDREDLVRRVNYFLVDTIALKDEEDLDLETISTIEDSIQEVLFDYSDENNTIPESLKNEYFSDVSIAYANLFSDYFEEELNSIPLLTEIEKEIKNIISSNNLLSNPECVFIKEAILKVNSTFINNARKELLNS